MNQTAKKGQVFVCGACGKRSKDKYGDQAIDEGWDVSCSMHAILCKEDSIKLKDGRAVKAEAIDGGK
jgi:hypothetical protein